MLDPKCHDAAIVIQRLARCAFVSFVPSLSWQNTTTCCTTHLGGVVFLVRLCAGGLSSGRVPSDSSGSASRPFTHPPTCLPDVLAWLPAQLQCFCALLLPSGLLSVCARLTVCANVISRSLFCLLALCCRFRKNRGDGSSTAGGVSAFAATLRTT